MKETLIPMSLRCRVSLWPTSFLFVTLATAFSNSRKENKQKNIKQNEFTMDWKAKKNLNMQSHLRSGKHYQFYQQKSFLGVSFNSVSLDKFWLVQTMKSMRI